MRLALVCAAAALATSSLAVAAEPAAAPGKVTASENVKAKKPRKVCRRDTSTGSTIPKKICRTVVETAEPAKQAQAPVAATNVLQDGTAAE